jgi:hypothetical protein
MREADDSDEKVSRKAKRSVKGVALAGEFGG